MKNAHCVAALVLTGLAGVVSPAAAQDRVHLQMAAELRILQEQQAQMLASMAQLAQTMADSFKGLGARIDQTNELMVKRFADQSLAMGNLADDIRVIRTNTQDIGTRLGQLREELDALRASITQVLTTRAAPVAPVDPLDPNAPPIDPAQVAAPPPLEIPSTVGLSPDRMYATADADYAAGQWDLAISGFEQFIRTFRDSNRADDAQRFIGDAEYARGRFAEAIAAYNLVIQNYPKGDQLPWAYYKRGVVQDRLQQAEDARASFELAIKTAPGAESNVAVLAKQNLDRIARRAPARP